MERNSNAVFSRNVQPYPTYNEKQQMTFHQTNNPTVSNSLTANPQYLRNNSYMQQQVYPQAIPVQNYRVSATSPIRVSQAALHPQVVTSQAIPYYLNANQSTRVSYDGNPNVVGMAIPQQSQSIVRKMMPITQYVPVDVIEPAPVVSVSPPPPNYYNHYSAIYAEQAPVMQSQQRVINHQPEIYEKRSIRYTPPAPPSKVTAVQKIVVEEPKQEEFKDPMVQTVKNSYDAASVRSSRIAPPPPKTQETKTPCATWLLALLGLLGLIGLILAIVLSQNSRNSRTVQTASPTVAEPQRVSSVVPTPKASVIAPTQDFTNAQVKGQTVVTAPTPVVTPTPTTQTAPTVAAPRPTDISVTQPAVVNTQTTVLSGVQPQTIAPTYASTTQAPYSSSTTTTTTNSNTQPMTVQPVMTPGTQTTSTSSTSSTTQPTSVQPTATSSSTTQPTTVQPTARNVDWIPASSGSTSSTTSTSTAPIASTSTSPTVSSQPATSVSSSSNTSTTSPTTTTSTTQPQTISPTPVAPTTGSTTTTTTTTVTTKPSHFLTLRHHL